MLSDRLRNYANTIERVGSWIPESQVEDMVADIRLAARLLESEATVKREAAALVERLAKAMSGEQE